VCRHSYAGTIQHPINASATTRSVRIRKQRRIVALSRTDAKSGADVGARTGANQKGISESAPLVFVMLRTLVRTS
jgi:hypothetical protein